MDNLVPVLREVFNKIPNIRNDRELLKNMVLGYTITVPEENTNFEELLTAGFIDALFNVQDVTAIKNGAGAIATIVATKCGCDREKIVHSINLWYQVIKNADDQLIPEADTGNEEVIKTPQTPIEVPIQKTVNDRKEDVAEVSEPEKTENKSESASEEKTETKEQPSKEETKDEDGASERTHETATSINNVAAQKKSGLSNDTKLGLICFAVFLVFLFIKLNQGPSMLERSLLGSASNNRSTKKVKVEKPKTSSFRKKQDKVDLSFLDKNTAPVPVQEKQPENVETAKPVSQPETKAEIPVVDKPEQKQIPQRVEQKKNKKNPSVQHKARPMQSQPAVKNVPVQTPKVQPQAVQTPAPVQKPDDAELARRRREENLRRIQQGQ